MRLRGIIFVFACLSSFCVAVSTFAAADVIVTQVPPLLRQFVFPGEPRVTGTLTLTNIGDASTTIVMNQQGAFFTMSPQTFALASGVSQVVTITAGDEPADLAPQEGYAIPVGSGIPAGMRIPVKILFSGSFFIIGENEILPDRPRIEISAPAFSNPSGVALFKNIGVGNRAIVTSDAPWLITDTFFTIGDDETKELPFTIDRTLRPDSRSLNGSVAGSISMTYETETGVKGAYKSYVTVVDTVKPNALAAPVPAVSAGELALFVPGVGNVTGSGGKVFLSDVNVLNPSGAAIPDLKLYFQPAAGNSLLVNPGSVSSGQSLALADVVKSVFGVSEQLGTLHVRGSNVGFLAVSANVFNVNNPAGTYGTTIPVFRSDRASSSGDVVYISGVRRDGQSHTNLYLLETAGAEAHVKIEQLGANGNVLSSIPDQALAANSLSVLGNVAPAGAAAMRVTTLSGKAVAYATPLDEASGDTWAVADWNRYYAGDAAAAKVIPAAGVLQGAAGTYFRTDVSITNAGSGAATGTLSYYPQGGSRIDTPVSIASPGGTLTWGDVVTTRFNRPSPSLGFLVLTPTGGSRFSATSRTYTTVQGSTKTFGTAMPPLPSSAALRVGQSRIIGGLDDSTKSAVDAMTPGTFRTNAGLVETSGNSATVRVYVRFNNGRQLASGASQGFRDFPLQPYQIVLVNRVTQSVLGDSRDATFGDMHNLEVKFEVTSGSGSVMPFVTTTDNGSGDTVFRME